MLLINPKSNESGDDSLVRRAQAGDEVALAELFERHKFGAFGLALRMCENRQNAEDVLQMAWLQVFMSLHTFDFKSKFSTWLLSVVKNKCLDHLRKKAREIVLLETDVEGSPVEIDIKEELQLEWVGAGQADLAAITAEAIDNLEDPDAADVAYLFLFAGMKLKSISSTKGRNVRGLWYRTQARLQRDVEYRLRRAGFANEIESFTRSVEVEVTKSLAA